MANITRKDIPDAKYYVLANDPFLSGWGEAEGKTNTIILPCRDYYEAALVETHAKARGDMKRVRIVSNKPRLSNSVYYSLHGPEDYHTWYELYFIVSRKNDPKDGLHIECPKLDEMTGRDVPYNVNVTNARAELRGGTRTGLHSLWDVLNLCTEVAKIAGCQQITIEPI